MKRNSEGISSDQKQPKTYAHTVADNVRQGFNWCWITGVLSINDKAERSRKAFFIGHDPAREQMRHPTMGRLDEGI